MFYVIASAVGKAGAAACFASVEPDHRAGLLPARHYRSVGRGTLRMTELMGQSGMFPPEIEVVAGEVLVGFLPTRYVSPTHVRHDLTPLQRELLEILAQTGPVSLNVLMNSLSSATPRRTVQDNLQMLRLLNLVDSSGKGVGARWKLKGVPP